MLFNKTKTQRKVYLIIILFLININSLSSNSKNLNNKLKSESKSKKIKKLLRELTTTSSNTLYYNDGDWNSGYKCPKFLIADGSNDQINQGGILLKAKEITENQGEYKNGFFIEFENPPKENSLIFKVAKKINPNKFYIPWRFFDSDNILYNNPFYGNKTIKGSLFTDDKQIFHYTIKLPYRMFNWYISDEEGYKLIDAMKKIANDTKTNIKNAKENLSEKSNNYFTAMENVKELEKIKTDTDKLKALMQKNEAELNIENGINSKLNTEKIAAQKKMMFVIMKLMGAKLKYLSLVSKLNNNNKEIVLLHEWIEKVKNQKDTTSVLAESNKLAENSFNAADKQFGVLKENAIERVKEIDASKAGLKAEDKNVFQSNLDKIYP